MQISLQFYEFFEQKKFQNSNFFHLKLVGTPGILKIETFYDHFQRLCSNSFVHKHWEEPFSSKLYFAKYMVVFWMRNSLKSCSRLSYAHVLGEAGEDTPRRKSSQLTRLRSSSGCGFRQSDDCQISEIAFFTIVDMSHQFKTLASTIMNVIFCND